MTPLRGRTGWVDTDADEYHRGAKPPGVYELLSTTVLTVLADREAGKISSPAYRLVANTTGNSARPPRGQRTCAELIRYRATVRSSHYNLERPISFMRNFLPYHLNVSRLKHNAEFLQSEYSPLI